MSSTDEIELATKMLQIQHKRFYLDVKQNRRGRFFKVAEVGTAGRKSRLSLAMSTAGEFRDHLTAFSELYASLGPPNPDSLPEDGKLKSEVMVKDNRRYYLDLKENNRGRFLRVSQTMPRGVQRAQIAIPAQGMIEFRDALTDLLDEFGNSDGCREEDKVSSSGFEGELPEGKLVRTDSKKFYFDIGQNNLGIYLRISEVKNNFRSSITIPEKSWVKFRDIFTEYVDKMRESSEEKIPSGGTGANGGGSQGCPQTPGGDCGVNVSASEGGNALSTTTSK
ncbi:transcriptional activator protein Pur-beta [Tetranychus urticae]|nr:transcriptional activator protein Pur-beta [Tetranychus urticae]XP_015786839.1 transcriptional activator protein Pur-beta [Tetranychus urticae]XP_025017003.1 transcriptional activator protein Pur-beta [Tetranychus urticae]